MKNSWKVTCVGTVVEVSYLPTDKTGRDERGISTLTVEPESIEAEIEGVSFGPTLDFDMDRERLERRLKKVPAIGDRLHLTGTCTGIRPRNARIDTIKRLETTETTETRR